MDTSAFVQRVTLVALCLGLIPALAAGQPVPRSGQVAAGAEVGLYVPRDGRLQSGIVGGGHLEFYATPRVGIRGSATAIRTGYDRFDDDDERQLRFGLDLIYNWEYGTIHPFLGGGIALHRLSFHRGGRNVGPNDTQVGAQALGGIEFFLNQAWAVKTEARYQWVGDRPNLNPDGLALTVGLKRYF
jgi:opacity protein-like surface antigen